MSTPDLRALRRTAAAASAFAAQHAVRHVMFEDVLWWGETVTALHSRLEEFLASRLPYIQALRGG